MKRGADQRVTGFQEKVYRIVSIVPKGRVTTYKLLAARVQCGSCRAVGQALRKNPFAPVVPCHRVIASDLSAGGFEGKRQGAALARKLKLLAREGVFFKNGKLVDERQLFVPRKR